MMASLILAPAPIVTPGPTDTLGPSYGGERVREGEREGERGRQGGRERDRGGEEGGIQTERRMIVGGERENAYHSCWVHYCS